MEQHYRQLESMYQAAPVNEFYKPVMTVTEGQAEISILTDARHHHSAGGMHGSVYFKMLDDAAWFACNSLEKDVFVLTTSFTTYITRPVSEGKITAIGNVVNKNNSQWIAEAVLYNEEGKELARGNGIFVRSKMPLIDAKGFAK
ncbi:PaaI family thioesterase [Pseudomonas sp. HK3]